MLILPQDLQCFLVITSSVCVYNGGVSSNRKTRSSVRYKSTHFLIYTSVISWIRSICTKKCMSRITSSNWPHASLILFMIMIKMYKAQKIKYYRDRISQKLYNVMYIGQCLWYECLSSKAKYSK